MSNIPSFFFFLMCKPYIACHTILHSTFMAHLQNWALVSRWIRCAKNFLYKYSQSCEKISGAERRGFYALFSLENLQFFRIFIFSIIRGSQGIQNLFAFRNLKISKVRNVMRASRYYSRLLENCLNDWKESRQYFKYLGDRGNLKQYDPYYPAITSIGDLALL